MTKKIFTLFITVFCVLGFCVHTFAVYPTSNVVSLDDIDVIFDENSAWTFNEMQAIAKHLVYGTENAQAYGLVCNIFGHKNTTEYVTTITHSAYTTAPRCLEEQWELTVCSRCDNTESRRIAFTLIFCCPED